MQQLRAEAERARRLAETAYDSRLASELRAYAAELEGRIARHRRERLLSQQLGF